MLMRFGMMLVVLIMAACQSLPKIEALPLLSDTLTLQISEEKNGMMQNSLLIIESQSEQQWRFIQVDALGAPIARQTLHAGKWANDGFLPPNRQASVLFSAIYAYLATEKQWPLPEGLATVQIENQPEGTVYIKWQDQSWQVRELMDE